jgi:hypothetical protein
MNFSFPAAINLLSRKYFPKTALRNSSILYMKPENSELFVTYCLIGITGDISQKAEERSVEERHFYEYLPTATTKSILLYGRVITGTITQNAA